MAKQTKRVRCSKKRRFHLVKCRAKAYQPKRTLEETNPSCQLGGRRLITVGSWQESLNMAASHGGNCTNCSLAFEKEIKTGLRSRVKVVCRSCNWSQWICTDKEESQVSLPVNEALVWGTNAGASHFEAVKELMTVLDIPFPTFKFFNKVQEAVSNQWNDVLMEELIENGKAEAKAAVEAGDTVEVNGTVYPCTGVFADGGWSTRSYGHSCKSKGGIAVLIGARTNKILHLGIKNMFCIICKRSSNAHKSSPDHVCYKNWSETVSATSMESKIVLEGFQSSLKDHGLVYNRLIADGDSSVYTTLLGNPIYPGIRIQKAECVNHVIKNLNKALIKLTKDTAIPLAHRRLLKPQLRRFGKSVRSAIIFRHNSDRSKHQLLRSDIMNLPFHIFGDHSNCASYFCKKTPEPNRVPEIVDLAIWKKILELVNKVSFMSERLIPNYTSNVAESFMSRMAKYNHGKRLHVTQRFGWHSRAVTAALSFTKGKSFYLDICKRLTGKSPSRHWQQASQITQKRASRVRRYDAIKRQRATPIKKSTRNVVSDLHYGPNAASPDLDDDSLQLLLFNLKVSLQLTFAEREELSFGTREQSGSERWVEERSKRITASMAGEVFSLKDSTSNSSLVKKMLYPKSLSHVAAIKFGCQNEKNAILAYEAVSLNKVVPTGLVVSSENGIFAVSPDGLIGNDGLLEIKCPSSIVGFPPHQMPHLLKGRSYLKSVGKSETSLELARSHKYFKQVVMLLHVTNRNWCDFVVYSFKEIAGVRHDFPLFIQRIYRTEETAKLWLEMKAKFIRFYDEDLGPEIVNPRVQRGMPIRQPFYRQRAIQEAGDRKRQTSHSSVEVPKKKSRERLGQTNTRDASEEDPHLVLVQAD